MYWLPFTVNTDSLKLLKANAATEGYSASEWRPWTSAFKESYYTFDMLLFYSPTTDLGKVSPVGHIWPAVCLCPAHVRPGMNYAMSWSIAKVVWLDCMQIERCEDTSLELYSNFPPQTCSSSCSAALLEDTQSHTEVRNAAGCSATS